MTDQTSSLHDVAPAAERSDADLVLRTRSGDAGAYAELWRRHYASGIAVARSITSTFDADDLVQEAFARIYQAIQKGGGPTGSFRAYLFTSIRNTAAGWGRARREAPIDELDTVADPSSTDQAANDALDRSLSAQAFRSLPSRWQEVLWYSEIEQMKPAEIAPLLGMSAGATAQLAFRAREGLREAWIRAHLSTAEAGSVCEWTIERLGAYSRGNLGARDRGKLEDHLSECARCLIVAAEAKEVSHRLVFVLLPLVLGITGSSAYLAMLQSGSAPVVALAAMPSSVVQGAVVAGSAGAAGAGSAAGGSGSTSGGGASVAGFGALVGAGSAALVIAGAIVAAAVVPGLTASPASTSAPSAADQSDSSIVAQVSQPQTVPVIPPAPPSPPAQVPAPAPRRQKPKTLPVGTPVDAAATEPAGGDTAVLPPTTPVDPGTDPGTVPGTDPGTVPDPGTGPGTDPGTGPGTDPGTAPGTDPGTGPGTDPGTDPGAGPGTDPGPAVPPSSAPLLGTATLSCGILAPIVNDIDVTVPVSGVAGATVQAALDGGRAQTASTTLDATGAGVIVLHPTVGQVNGGQTVTFAYVLGDQVGGSTVFDLGALGPVHWAECLTGTANASAPPAPASAPALAPATTQDPMAAPPAPSPLPAPSAPATAPATGRSRETAPLSELVPGASPTAPTPAAPTPTAPTSAEPAPAPVTPTPGA